MRCLVHAADVTGTERFLVSRSRLALLLDEFDRLRAELADVTRERDALLVKRKR